MKLPAFLKKQTVTQAALIIAIISFISKFFGFFREVLVAKYFGATGQTDAFLVALIIPSLILGLFSGGFATLIIPFYLEKKAQSQEAARRFVNSVFMVWGTIFIILSILIFIFAPFCVRIIAYGFKGETFSLAVSLTRYLIISGLFTVLTGMFTGLLQAEKQFFFPIFVTFIGNIGLVLSLFFLHRYLGIHSWTLGQIFCWGFAFFSMLFILYWRFKFFHSISYNQIDWPEIKKFALLLLPLVISGGLSVLNQIIDKTIASSLDAGSIAALNFATRIWQVPFSLLAVPIATAVFPSFSELALHGTSRKEYETRLNRTLSYVFYLTIPSTVYLFFLSEPIVKLFFERGAFDVKATALTSFVLKMYVLGLFAHSISPILARAFYSFKNTKTPLIISAICISLNIILNILLSRLLGAPGIALATSIVMTIDIILYRHYLRKYVSFFSTSLNLDIIKILLSSVPIGIICYFSLPFLKNIPTASFSGFFSLASRISAVCLLSLLPFLILSRLFDLEPYILLKSYMLNLIKKFMRQ
ncbi:MAG: putative peptidoglycan lipid II flippase MurJ [Candidatus Saccharicenans subterraneus]|uniref:Probable lipid II flippase MurJ n=1 Tax=Candidatus Saccharicenans subterraneus TaxID=2508984 RepID=A0A3E2BLZ0_9BACT|nr:MAG: putative peptidoglycan lipid II flippase MurJ [Candidatus Saccharicenans subterraneum]